MADLNTLEACIFSQFSGGQPATLHGVRSDSDDDDGKDDGNGNGDVEKVNCRNVKLSFNLVRIPLVDAIMVGRGPPLTLYFEIGPVLLDSDNIPIDLIARSKYNVVAPELPDSADKIDSTGSDHQHLRLTTIPAVLNMVRDSMNLLCASLADENTNFGAEALRCKAALLYHQLAQSAPYDDPVEYERKGIPELRLYSALEFYCGLIFAMSALSGKGIATERDTIRKILKVCQKACIPNYGDFQIFAGSYY